jgi:predicted RND superfamily exporter protein
MLLYQTLIEDETLHIITIDAWFIYEQRITDELILNHIRPQFINQDVRRMIVTLNMEEESEETFLIIDKINTHLTDQGFEIDYMIGNSVASYVLKDIIEDDYQLVIWIAIIAVILVILMLYRNLFIPILLSFVILGSVFIAMSIPYLAQNSLSFLGYFKKIYGIKTYPSQA